MTSTSIMLSALLKHFLFLAPPLCKWLSCRINASEGKAGILKKGLYSRDAIFIDEVSIRYSTMKTQILVLSVALAGCATTSEIVPYGKDTYMLSSDDIWGGHSGGSLQVKAAQSANAFCAKQGKQFIVRNTGTQGLQGWTPTSSTLIFSCISEKDPEFQRPNLRAEPTTIIEDRRK